MASLFSSSSFEIPTSDKYDVFLSFGGMDTREKFARHLLEAFYREIIKTFPDINTFEAGKMEGPQTSEAIKRSKVSIIIFSENYASSTCCLEELTQILECKRKTGQVVMPIFYKVEPSDVREQRGSYATAFSLHEERFKHERNKVQQWRKALSEAANLSGWDSRVHRSEFRLVEAIVRDVKRKLNKLPKANLKGLVGIEKCVEEINKLLCIGLDDVRVVGIWGMGGIGKTTLAAAVYDHLSSLFEGHYFLANVREKSKKNGLDSLQGMLISKLSDIDVNAGITTSVKYRLTMKRVLLVLDDVDDLEQIEFLAGDEDRFGVGSRILITSRDKQLLKNTADEVYEVRELNYDDSMELFYLNAFTNNFSPTDYLEVSESILNYCSGLPLAIKTLGSYLHSKSKSVWESTLCKLKEAPIMEVQEVLRRSYDGLADKDKKAFLDIVCFLKGEDRDFVEQFLEYVGSFTPMTVDHLVDKSLIIIKHDKQLWMHNLVQEMGWEIVRQESIAEPGKRSRLRNNDVYYVSKANTGTAAIEGIYLEISQINKDIELPPTAFQEMHNLRLLKIIGDGDNTKKSNVHFPQGLESLSSSLTYLHWDGCPLECFPLNFTPNNLVGLILTNSHIKLLWRGIKDLQHLKLLDLSHSKQLTEIPDFNAPNLEILNLKMCESLEYLPGSISSLESLKKLNICCCTKLKYLPRLPSNLQNLNAKGCKSLETVSKSGIALSQARDDSFQYSSGRFDFINCLRLDGDTRINIMAEAQLRLFKMATLSYKDKVRRISEVWCPGNEIPEWFEFQSESSSLRVNLDPTWSNTNFLGFALSVVVDFKKGHIGDDFHIFCLFSLTVYSQPRQVRREVLDFNWMNDPDGSDHQIIVDSEHVFLFNYYNKNIFTAKYNNKVTEASFEFYCYKTRECTVKRCGVHLYAKDVEKIKLNLNQRAGESSSEEEEEEDEGEGEEEEEEDEEEEEKVEDLVSDFEDGITHDVVKSSEIEEDEDFIRGHEYGSLIAEPESSGDLDFHQDDTKKEEGDSNPLKNYKTESPYSCSCLMFLSLVRDIFKHVVGRQSRSDDDSHHEERLQGLDQVLHNIMMELEKHNKHISHHVQTLMPTTHVTPSMFKASEKKLHETPEEIIDSLCSQIIAVRDQNNEILRNLRTLLSTRPDDQLVGIYPELAPSSSASSMNVLLKDVIADDQHVDVPEEVIHSLQSHLTVLQDHNQQILQFLHNAMFSPTRVEDFKG